MRGRWTILAVLFVVRAVAVPPCRRQPIPVCGFADVRASNDAGSPAQRAILRRPVCVLVNHKIVLPGHPARNRDASGRLAAGACATSILS